MWTIRLPQRPFVDFSHEFRAADMYIYVAILTKLSLWKDSSMVQKAKSKKLSATLAVASDATNWFVSMSSPSVRATRSIVSVKWCKQKKTYGRNISTYRLTFVVAIGFSCPVKCFLYMRLDMYILSIVQASLTN